jgi:YVTN family beta-propeller protein
VISVVDSIHHEAGGTIHLGEPGVIKPMTIILSPDAKKAYVSTGRGHKVFVIDTVKNEVLTSFPVGQRPWGLALSPDGQTLYTANGPSDDVSVIDLRAGTVVAKVKVGRGPWGILALATP